MFSGRKYIFLFTNIIKINKILYRKFDSKSIFKLAKSSKIIYLFSLFQQKDFFMTFSVPCTMNIKVTDCSDSIHCKEKDKQKSRLKDIPKLTEEAEKHNQLHIDYENKVIPFFRIFLTKEICKFINRRKNMLDLMSYNFLL